MPEALTDRPETQKRMAAATEQDTPHTDWCSKVSDHVAFALLVYTGLHIFVTMTALKTGGGSLLPYFALVVLVAAIIPGLRAIERRWQRLVASDITESGLASAFRREMALLWAAAIGLPVVLTLAAKAVIALF